MAHATGKPVIFISYARKDEPERPTDGEIRWLTFMRRLRMGSGRG